MPRSEIRQAAEEALLELGIDDDMLGKVAVTKHKWGRQVKFFNVELSLTDLFHVRNKFNELYQFSDINVRMTSNNDSYGVLFKVFTK